MLTLCAVGWGSWQLLRANCNLTHPPRTEPAQEPWLLEPVAGTPAS